MATCAIYSRRSHHLANSSSAKPSATTVKPMKNQRLPWPEDRAGVEEQFELQHRRHDHHRGVQRDQPVRRVRVVEVDAARHPLQHALAIELDRRVGDVLEREVLAPQVGPERDQDRHEQHDPRLAAAPGGDVGRLGGIRGRIRRRVRLGLFGLARHHAPSVNASCVAPAARGRTLSSRAFPCDARPRCCSGPTACSPGAPC